MSRFSNGRIMNDTVGYIKESVELLLPSHIMCENYLLQLVFPFTVKSFNFMGTKFRGLRTMDMFVDN